MSKHTTELKQLRNKLMITLLCVLAWRLLSWIPLPMLVDMPTHRVAESSLLAFLNTLGGGSIERLSWVMIGLWPVVLGAGAKSILVLYSEKYQERAEIDQRHGGRRMLWVSAQIVALLSIAQCWATAWLFNIQDASIDIAATSMSLFVGCAATFLLVSTIDRLGIGGGVKVIILANVFAVTLPPLLDFSWLQLIGSTVAWIVLSVLTVRMFKCNLEIKLVKNSGDSKTVLRAVPNESGAVLLGGVVFYSTFGLLSGVFWTTGNVFDTEAWSRSSPIIAILVQFLIISYFHILLSIGKEDVVAKAKEMQTAYAHIPDIQPGRATEVFLLGRRIQMYKITLAFFLLVVVCDWVAQKLLNTPPFVVSFLLLGCVDVFASIEDKINQARVIDRIDGNLKRREKRTVRSLFRRKPRVEF